MEPARRGMGRDADCRVAPTGAIEGPAAKRTVSLQVRQELRALLRGDSLTILVAAGLRENERYNTAALRGPDPSFRLAPSRRSCAGGADLRADHRRNARSFRCA